MSGPTSEGGTNFFDTLSAVLPVAIAAIADEPLATVRPTTQTAISTNTVLLIGGGLVVVVVAIFLFR